MAYRSHSALLLSYRLPIQWVSIVPTLSHLSSNRQRATDCLFFLSSRPSLSSQSHLRSHFSILYILGIYQFRSFHSNHNFGSRSDLVFYCGSEAADVSNSLYFGAGQQDRFFYRSKGEWLVVESPQSRRVGRFCHVHLMGPWCSNCWCTQPDLVFHPSRLEKTMFFLHLLLKHQLLSAPFLPSSSWLLVAVESDKGSGGQHKRQSRNK